MTAYGHDARWQSDRRQSARQGPDDDGRLVLWRIQGDAGVKRPAPDATEAEWFSFVYLRDNPSGWHQELWLHSAGCRSWFTLRRDTRTHEIAAGATLHQAFPKQTPVP